MKRWILSLALVCATSVWAAPEWVRGEITKLAPEKAQVTLKHEAMKSMGMDAMTMPYKVKNAALLKDFKPGDKVRFTVSMQGDAMLIESLEHAK
ncbi:MAG: copper-binding protein [Rhodoferax sp.]|nr:copper-binding protein [Rhodoferax sp.]